MAHFSCRRRRLESEVNKIREARDEDSLRQKTNHIQECRDQLRELTKSVLTALQDLRWAVKTHEKELEKTSKRAEKEESKKKDAEQKLRSLQQSGQQQQLAQAAAARSTAKGAQDLAIFSSDETTGNVQEVSLQELQTIMEAGALPADPVLDWDSPMIIKAGGSDFDAQLQSAKMQGCLQYFRDIFKKDPAAAKTGRAKICMQAGNGLEEAATELQLVMPPDALKLSVPEVAVLLGDKHCSEKAVSNLRTPQNLAFHSSSSSVVTALQRS